MTALVPLKPKAAKVPKLKTGNDAEVAERFVSLFNDAQNGLRRVCAFGLYALQVKHTMLKHSQFGAWVEANCTQASYRAVRAHMQLTTSVLENECGVKSVKSWIKNMDGQIGSALPFSHCGELLLLPEAKVPDKVQTVREKFFACVDGKSQRQLFAEFKQEDDRNPESNKSKRGNLKGKGGPTKQQRTAAKDARAESERKAIELEARNWVSWVKDNCDDKHLGIVSDEVWRVVCDSHKVLGDYIRHVNEVRASRKSGGAA